MFQKLSTLVNGAKIKRETSKSLLRGRSEQVASKSREKSRAEKSVAIGGNVPVQVEQNRQLATAEGNSTLDKEREEVWFIRNYAKIPPEF